MRDSHTHACHKQTQSVTKDSDKTASSHKGQHNLQRTRLGKDVCTAAPV